MSLARNLKHAITDPIIPYNSLYIDVSSTDIIRALRTPGLVSQITTPLQLYPIDPSISCQGCRVRQLHGLQPYTASHNYTNSTHFETPNDVYKRLQALSWSPSYIKGESFNSIHFDIASLWARNYINNTSTHSIGVSPQPTLTTPYTDATPLCQYCSLSSPQLTPHDPTNNNTRQPHTPPPHSYNTMAMLSVRSGLIAWLHAQAFPAGSIVIFSAINIPDMAKVIRAMGLVPLPIDIDLDTTQINLLQLKQTLDYYGTHQTRHLTEKMLENEEHKKPRICAVILSYIFGIRNNISHIIELLHQPQYALPVIEDCAEAYTDINFTGHPEADMTLFSFGSIKNSTAFGGGIVRVRNFEIYLKMMQLQCNSWGKCSEDMYLQKVKKMLPLSLAMNVPTITALTYRLGKLSGVDVKETAVAKLRGFPGDQMLVGIQNSPSTALLYMLRHRIARERTPRLALSAQKGAVMEAMIKKYNINLYIVGEHAASRGYWLYPFIVDNSSKVNSDGDNAAAKTADDVTRELGDKGVQVYRGATQLTCLPLPDELLDGDNTPPFKIIHAQYIMDNVIYLPLTRYIPDATIERIAQHLLSICGMRALGDGCNNVRKTKNTARKISKKQATSENALKYNTISASL